MTSAAVFVVIQAHIDIMGLYSFADLGLESQVFFYAFYLLGSLIYGII